ncbi:MAG: histidine phosphatase family protein [Bacillota bacterium]|jgi:probable phosphoglycerate mutase|nr:histidine phosphatase family protein [Candidatus Fermentithermobacillaceae bacterium]
MTTFYVVRHGETEANKSGILQGHLDVPLSETGRRQAKAVAEALSRVRLDAVYSSDLSRARETAEAIMMGRTCRLILDRRLRELDMGGISGLTLEESRAKYPEFHARLAHDPYGVRRPGGGESRLDLRDRMSRALDDIYERHKDARIGIVSHGGAINALLNIVSPDGTWPSLVVANCSVTVLERDDTGWRTVKINDCDHLRAFGDDLDFPPDPSGGR